MQPRTIRELGPTILIAVLLGAITPIPTIYGQSNTQNTGRIRAAQDFERRGNFESALRIYRSLYELVPNNQLYYEGVKRNMLRLKRYDELVAVVQWQISRSNDLRFPADLGNVYYKKGGQSQALEIWDSLLKNHPRNRAVYPYVANAMLDNRLYDEAIEVYRGGRRELGDDLLFVFELANIYAIRLSYKQATLEYLRFLEKNPQQLGYIEGRIASYTTDPEKATEVAEVLRTHLPTHKQKHLVRKLLADLYLRVEEYGQSLHEFRILEDEMNRSEGRSQQSGKEIYFFAEKALKAGEYEYAEEAFDLILSKYSESPLRPRALYGVALAKQKKGIYGEALRSYEELITITPDSPWAQEAMFQIGEIYFENLVDMDKALEAYDSLVRKYPNGNKAVDAAFRIGDCYAAKGDLTNAQTWYERPMNVRNSKSESNRSYYKSAYTEFLSGKFDLATEKLSKITENVGRGKEGGQSFVNDALELMILIEENKDTNSEALAGYAEAQKLRVQREIADAIRKLQDILTNYPTASIADESLFDLGDLENERGNYSAAIAHFEGLLTDHPESVYCALAQKRIGEIFEHGVGDFEKAYEAYEVVLINHSQSVYLEEVRQKLRDLQSRQLSN